MSEMFKIPHCHICYIMVNLDNPSIFTCERCDNFYCIECGSVYTIHNQLDYNCCSDCANQTRIGTNKVINNELYIKLQTDYDNFKTKYPTSFYMIETFDTEEYLLKLYGKPKFVITNSPYIAVNFETKSWWRVYGDEIISMGITDEMLYQLSDFKQQIRNDKLKLILS